MAGEYKVVVRSSERAEALFFEARIRKSSVQAAARDAIARSDLHRSGNKGEVLTIHVERVG